MSQEKTMLTKMKIIRALDCNDEPIVEGNKVRKVGNPHSVQKVTIVRGDQIGFDGCGMYSAGDYELIEGE